MLLQRKPLALHLRGYRMAKEACASFKQTLFMVKLYSSHSSAEKQPELGKGFIGWENLAGK